MCQLRAKVFEVRKARASQTDITAEGKCGSEGARLTDSHERLSTCIPIEVTQRHPIFQYSCKGGEFGYPTENMAGADSSADNKMCGLSKPTQQKLGRCRADGFL